MVKKILTFIVMCILIGVVIFITYKLTNKGIDIVSEADSQNASTYMLVVQAKQKVISEKAIVDGNKEGYKGVQFKEENNNDIEEFKNLKIISSDEEFYDEYYIWNQEVLDGLGIKIILKQGEYYIVNYETNEVINTLGVKIGDKIYYKLSEVKQVIVPDENSEENVD